MSPTPAASAPRRTGAFAYQWHDGQLMSRHHLRVVTEAAKRRIAVNPHEPIKDTGLRRTYPNWVSREGARGMEYNAWGDPPNPPEHEANLVFTRMLAGPMDFTPGILSLTGRGGQQIQSTLAKQLALYVVIYSPIQMAADLPENYARYRGAVPVHPRRAGGLGRKRACSPARSATYAAIARKDRGSEDWYLGASPTRRRAFSARAARFPRSRHCLLRPRSTATATTPTGARGPHLSPSNRARPGAAMSWPLRLRPAAGSPSASSASP